MESKDHLSEAAGAACALIHLLFVSYNTLFEGLLVAFATGVIGGVGGALGKWLFNRFFKKNKDE